MPNIYQSSYSGAGIDNAIAKTNSITVPTKLSDLTNDRGYITSASVPTKVSDLTNDSGYITSASLPTKTSDLNNNSGFITFNQVYPIGAIYLSVNNTNPSTLFGGTWEQIQDTFLLAAGSTYTGGTTGGQSSYTAADMPAHTHTRGTMEIEGTYRTSWTDASGGGIINGGDYTGALSGYHDGNAYYATSNATSNSTSHKNWIKLKASDNWTGETSQSGTNASATIMPPYLAVYVWKRTA